MIQNAFNEVLVNQRKGELLTELSRAMQEATQAVKEQKKQATITLKITIAPANGDASAVQVVDDITVKVPKPPTMSSLFYTTDENNLVRKDPNQREMVLQEVQRPVVAQEAPPLAKVS